MVNSVKKLITTELSAYQTYIYFNMYLLRSVFFRCEVVKISEKQEKDLKKMYEIPLLTKLKLGEKFPRKVLYVRRIAMRVGLIQPCIAIVIVTLQLYFGNIRIESNAGNIILALEELMEVNNGYSNRINKIDKKQRYWNRD